MSVHSKLQKFAINLVSDDSEINIRVCAPNASSSAERPANPTVSCLMVTRGNIDLLKCSLPIIIFGLTTEWCRWHGAADSDGSRTPSRRGRPEPLMSPTAVVAFGGLIDARWLIRLQI
jgi:hypothetical protein